PRTARFRCSHRWHGIALFTQEAVTTVRLEAIAKPHGDILAGGAGDPQSVPSTLFSQISLLHIRRITSEQRTMLGLVGIPGRIGVGLGFVGPDLERHRAAGRSGMSGN